VNTQELMEIFETAGLIVRNGAMRLSSKGAPQPVYEVAPRYANNIGAAYRVLDELAPQYISDLNAAEMVLEEIYRQCGDQSAPHDGGSIASG